MAVLPGLRFCSAAWGDYDNDGDPDLALSGYGTNGIITRVYRNDSGAFTNYTASLVPVQRSEVAWGDYDNDGDLDLALSGYSGSNYLASIYRNYISATNTPPTVPGNPVASLTNEESMVLSWEASTDAQTPSAGLTYALYVGESPGSGSLCPPMADTTSGWRRVACVGYTKGLSWKLKGVPSGTTLYWGVQAVDPSCRGSVFATGSFSRTPYPDFVISSITCTQQPVALSVSVVVSNRGGASGDAGFLSAWADHSAVVGCGESADATNAVGVLAAGQTREIVFNGLGSVTTGGAKTCRVFIDSACGTVEEFEDNNQSTNRYSVATSSESFVFTAVALTDSVVLRWTDPLLVGMADSTVHIRYLTTHYPSNLTEGTELYTGTNLVYEHTGLTPNQPYYYTIWVSNDGAAFVEPPE